MAARRTERDALFAQNCSAAGGIRELKASYGRLQARHDDDVTALGAGLACAESARMPSLYANIAAAEQTARLGRGLVSVCVRLFGCYALKLCHCVCVQRCVSGAVPEWLL